MAEVTREMILDYMQAKGGVVKNVDLVRHFRKFLQLSDARVKDQARELFKARVNEVAYIKADNKGEKYLYLKAEFGQAPTGSVAPSNRDSAHSILSNRDSTHSVLSKRDSAHSVLSKRDSTHSAYSKRDSAHSILSSNSSDNSGHNYGRVSGHQPPSGRDSGRQVSGHDSSLSSISRRTPPTDSPGHSSRSARASGHVNSTGYSSGQGPSSLGQSTSTTGHSSGQGSKLSSVREPPPPSSSSSGATTSLLGDSLLGDSLLGDTAFSSFLGGGSGLGSGGSGLGAAAASTRGGSSTSNTTTTGGGGGGGGDSSFASDIFGSIGSFWGDSGTTASSSGGSSAFSGDQKKPSSSVATSSALSSSSSGSRSSTQQTSSTVASSYSRESKSQVAGGISSDVTLQSYKPITSAAAPPTSTITSSAAPSRSSHVPPSPPPPSQSTRPPSPPPGSSSPAAPAPPRRNLSYTTTYAGSTSGGSAFSPPPPQSSSPGDGSTLLAQMTSELSSFGELGSLLDSFGDFSMDKPVSTSVASDPYTSKTTTSLSNSTDQLLTSSSYSSNLSDRSSKITSSSNSSDRSGRTVVASEKTEPKQVPPQPLTRHSPAKTSHVTTNTTTVHSRPPPPTSTPASGSPMRVPRRTVGAPVDPPPPPPSSQSPLTQRQGLYNGGHQQPETSPQINIQRVDSPRSDSSSNGVVSPLAGSNSSVSGGGDAGTLKGRSSGSGLPPLPPSAMLGATDSRRLTVTATNGGVGVALRQHDKSSRDRIQSSLRRSRNLEKNANLDTLTRASIMMTPPSVRRSMQAPGPGGAMFARPAPDSREDLSQYQGEGGDQDGSLSAPSEEYEEIDPLEKEWMLACASADMEELHSLIIRDSTLINRRDFLHGYTALHWAAKLGRCDFMSILVLNGAFVDIKSNGGFTPLHLACQGGYDNAIAMLIRDHRANVNTRDNSGRKPVNMLNCACSENIRGLLTRKLTGSKAVHHSSEHLPSFSQPRTRLGSLNSMWASMPNALECSDDKQKKRVSPRNVRKTFSFRSRNKLHSPPKEKDKKNDRPKSHIPTSGDSYDV